jgi:gliding motility associated protien GldN
MKKTLNVLGFILSLLILALPLGVFAQGTPTGVTTESGDPLDTRPVIDGVVEEKLVVESRVLPYDHVREADILWQRKIWRVIDVREKMNKSFAYPERPFFNILMEAATSGEITVYGTDDDKFTYPLTKEEVASKASKIDTVITFDIETYEEKMEVTRNDINPEDIKRFRIKEIWFFDEESSEMRVRILGIAPIKDVLNEDDGSFAYEEPLFWVYYPNAREVLARERAFNPGNGASPLSWEDILEFRYFSSYIYKKENEFNERLKDYLSGIDILYEGEKIRNEIFNWEQDLWSY